MDFTELLKNSGALEQLASQFGIGDSQVEEVVRKTLPEISKNINENTSTEDGLKSFWDALDAHKDAPVEEMLTDLNKVDTEDGEKILGHIFGEKKEYLTQELSQQQGLSASSIGGIMKFLAPILMGMIGRQAKAEPKKVEPKNADPDNGGLLDSFLGKDSAVSKMAKSFIDKNNDGSFLDDLLGGLFKK